MKKIKHKPGRTQLSIPASNTVAIMSGIDRRSKYLDIAALIVLFIFGVYISYNYYGYQFAPNSDFPDFLGVGHQLLSLHLPASYKRAPVLGLLQASLGHFITDQHPDLTAGWLLNAALYPVSMVILWLIARWFIGRAALWLTLVVMIHPWVIQSLIDPIAETCLLFFVLLTFYFICRRSNWAYLFASITSMVRYEGVALILAAFVVDMLSLENRRQRLKAFAYAAAASIPLALWMLGTVLSWNSQGSTYYLKELGAGSGGKFALPEFISMIWQSSFATLFLPMPAMSADASDMIFGLSKVGLVFALLWGIIYGLYRRQWFILAMLIFLVPYVCIHAAHGFVLPRFAVPVNWLVLLLAVYGLESFWKVLNKDDRLPRPLVIGMGGIVFAGALFWIAAMLPHMSRLAAVSPASKYVPYIVIALMLGFTAASTAVWKFKYLWPDIICCGIAALMVISNQFPLTQTIGDGKRDIEFKYLLDWYNATTKSGEKLLTTMPGNLAVFDPAHKDCFLHTGGITAKNPQEFVEECYKRGITYIAWDSRLGSAPGSRYYILWHLENIAQLNEPRSIGPYKYITTVYANKYRYVHIFLLKPQPLSTVTQPPVRPQ